MDQNGFLVHPLYKEMLKCFLTYLNDSAIDETKFVRQTQTTLCLTGKLLT